MVLVLKEYGLGLLTLEKVEAHQPARKNIYHSPEFSEPAIEFTLTWTDVRVLDLTLIAHSRCEIDWIAEMLGISAQSALASIEKLLDKRLIREKADGSFEKTKRKLYVLRRKPRACIEACLTKTHSI